MLSAHKLNSCSQRSFGKAKHHHPCMGCSGVLITVWKCRNMFRDILIMWSTQKYFFKLDHNNWIIVSHYITSLSALWKNVCLVRVKENTFKNPLWCERSVEDGDLCIFCVVTVPSTHLNFLDSELDIVALQSFVLLLFPLMTLLNIFRENVKGNSWWKFLLYFSLSFPVL